MNIPTRKASNRIIAKGCSLSNSYNAHDSIVLRFFRNVYKGEAAKDPELLAPIDNRENIISPLFNNGKKGRLAP